MNIFSKTIEIKMFLLGQLLASYNQSNLYLHNPYQELLEKQIQVSNAYKNTKDHCLKMEFEVFKDSEGVLMQKIINRNSGE